MKPNNAEYYASTFEQGIITPRDFHSLIRKAARLSMLRIASAVHRPSKDNFLRLLYCHYVFDDQKSQFEALINQLASIGKFIDTETCLGMLEGRQNIDDKYFHLSFDDGFRNVFTNAVPVLRQLEIPALIFVPSSIVSSDYKTTKQFCVEAVHCKNPVEMIRWRDLREMITWGYDVGSHTRSHVQLSNVATLNGSLRNEIFGSKQEIENNLGIECKYFSWPYGGLNDINETSFEMVREAGYKACFGAYRGAVSDKTDIFNIPRHHFEANWPFAHVRYFASGGGEK